MKRKNRKQTGWLLLPLFILAGCSQNPAAQQNPYEQNRDQMTDSSGSSQNESLEEQADDDIELDGLKEAEGNAISLDDYQESQGVKITRAGTYTLSGSGTVPVVVDARGEDVTLILNNVEIQTDTLPAIYVRKAENITIECEGKSTLSGLSSPEYEGLNALVYSKADLKLTGTGTLSLTAKTGHGIKAKDSMGFDGPTLNIQAQSDGIHINEDGTFQSGTLQIVTEEDEGIQAEQSLFMEGANCTIQSAGDGLRAEDQLVVKSGTIKIRSETEGMESKNSLLIQDGSISIQSVDDGINAANSLIVEGGTIRSVSSTNDGIDSNGDLLIKGGDVFASGTRAPEIAFDTDNTPFEITGGTVTGIGSALSIPTKMSNPVLAFQVSEATSVSIVQNGKTVASWSLPDGLSAQSGVMMITSSAIQKGVSATVVVNGNEQETMEIEEGMNTAGNVQSSGRMQGGQGGFNQRAPQNGQDPFSTDGNLEEWNPGEMENGKGMKGQKSGSRLNQNRDELSDADYGF